MDPRDAQTGCFKQAAYASCLIVKNHSTGLTNRKALQSAKS